MHPFLVILEASRAFQDDDLAEFTVTFRLVSVLASHMIFENVNSDKRFLADGAGVLQLFRLNFPSQKIQVSFVHGGLVLLEVLTKHEGFVTKAAN